MALIGSGPSGDRTYIVTGPTAGIGRQTALDLARHGTIVLVGRDPGRLDSVRQTIEGGGGRAVPVVCDLSDPASVRRAAARIIELGLPVAGLINNAGIMHIDDVSVAVDEKLLVTTLTTNVMGPIRLTGALIEHLKRQDDAAVINNSSVLGFVPLAMTAVYSATKAALHSYTLSLRYKLKGTPVKVLEIAPPWVQTDLLGSNNEPRAMPLTEFIEETMRVLGTDAEEVLVERAKPLRNNAGPNEAAFVNQFNDMMASPK